ncbi:class D beta-lactamase [Chitinophaga nivalis]|uniref:Beta-lactamase n=1 Tax=Chitinophaga nivalis TaxID=2991709 RepID=A0ABT3IVQ9_9BACT|nr:class D beta-lactamase [Chitinophaga nivalis]MCW3462241.1 class D beta-lactamase [Chitinophaga nivalis]MCW3488067.1 class D beta-lactamase [Chitinophaga nivalis]
MLAAIGLSLAACAPNNVKEEKNWEQYFAKHKVEGTFMLFNNSQGTFRVYNLERAKKRFLPASTFKILNSLVGLHTGAIRDTAMVIPWDGVTRPIEAWNHDLSMQAAFKASAVPYFQEVARRIGKPTMQMWLDSIKYGNMKISRIDTFWLDNSLQISPDEELGFVKKLYFDQLPFAKTTMKTVREVMLMEKTPKYELSYKTGLGTTNDVKRIGWIVGWIEENRHPSFFVLNIETENAQLNMPEVRMEILRNILTDAGYFKGEM